MCLFEIVLCFESASSILDDKLENLSSDSDKEIFDVGLCVDMINHLRRRLAKKEETIVVEVTHGINCNFLITKACDVHNC